MRGRPVDRRAFRDELRRARERPSDDRVCRICLVHEDGMEPLISPCPCRGTNAGVHFSCLRNWYEHRAKWTDLTCTACKHDFAGSTAVALGEIGLRMVESEHSNNPGVLSAMLANLKFCHAYRHGMYNIVVGIYFLQNICQKA